MKKALAVFWALGLCVCALGCTKSQAPLAPESSSTVSFTEPSSTSSGVSKNYRLPRSDTLLIGDKEVRSTCGVSYSLLFEPYTERVSVIDEIWYDIVGQERLERWMQRCEYEMTEGIFGKGPLLLQMITRFELSREDCSRAVAELQKKYLPVEPLYLSEADMDILCCGNMEKIDKYFVSHYAIFSQKDGEIRLGSGLLTGGIYSFNGNGILIDDFDAWCRTITKTYANDPYIINLLKDKGLKYRERYLPSSIHTLPNAEKNQWFRAYYQTKVTHIDTVWYDVLGKNRVAEWVRSYPSNIKNGIRPKVLPDLVQMLIDLEVSPTTARQVLAQLQAKTSPTDPNYISNEDIEIILTYDIEKNNARFADTETAILANGVIYSAFWLLNHSAADYKAAGITAAQLEEKLPTYAKLLGAEHQDYAQLYTQKLNDLKALEK